MSKTRIAVVVSTGLLLVGCDEADVTSMRMKLNDDLSGSVTVVSVATPDQPGAVGGISSGVTWGPRVSVTAVQGAFALVSDLTVANISFEADVSPGGMGRLEVNVPLGATADWIQAFSPLAEAERQELAGVLETSTARRQTLFSTASPSPTDPHPMAPSSTSSTGQGS